MNWFIFIFLVTRPLFLDFLMALKSLWINLICHRGTSLLSLGIPFDVVSLQQVHLDGELLLLVGIVENKNTYNQKVKRSKLGTAFFHAVSLFLNSQDLEKIISRIWEHTEADFTTRLVNNPAFSHIWRQVEQNGEMLHPCSIPGCLSFLSFFRWKFFQVIKF